MSELFRIEKMKPPAARGGYGKLCEALDALAIDQTIFVPFNGVDPIILRNRVMSHMYTRFARSGFRIHSRSEETGLRIWKEPR